MSAIYFSKEGLEKVVHFIVECWAKRKEILDAKKDDTGQTDIPTIEDIRSDIWFSQDDDGYSNCWGITSNYESDGPLSLVKNEDYAELDEMEDEERKRVYRY